jgi:hypothetical protein
MRGIERLVAAILLAGAVAGAALIPRFLAGPPGSSAVALAPGGTGHAVVNAAPAPPIARLSVPALVAPPVAPTRLLIAPAAHARVRTRAVEPAPAIGRRLTIPRIAPVARPASPAQTGGDAPATPTQPGGGGSAAATPATAPAAAAPATTTPAPAATPAATAPAAVAATSRPKPVAQEQPVAQQQASVPATKPAPQPKPRPRLPGVTGTVPVTLHTLRPSPGKPVTSDDLSAPQQIETVVSVPAPAQPVVTPPPAEPSPPAPQAAPTVTTTTSQPVVAAPKATVSTVASATVTAPVVTVSTSTSSATSPTVSLGGNG